MTMDADVATTLLPDDPGKLKLPRSFRGYDTGAVDKALQELAAGMETLTKERNELRERVQKLETELGEHKDSQELVRDTLVSAQRAADDLKERTQKECDDVLEAARVRAREIEDGSKLERERMQADLEVLRQQEQELRASYRVLLHAALDRLGEQSAQQATGVDASLLDALAPRRVIDEASATATDVKESAPATDVKESAPAAPDAEA
jgi:cell division initiation protein